MTTVVSDARRKRIATLSQVTRVAALVCAHPPSPRPANTRCGSARREALYP